ncbi:MAG: AMP-binding protein [Eubacteriales bacterium]|nr:AMP-binding protein [Eubacteriales bacterium]
MKISFSTLACPGYSFADIYSMAKDLGFDGIELRGVGVADGMPYVDVFDGKAPAFSAEKLTKTKETLRKTGLEISCISSGCSLRSKARHDENIKELKIYIDACEALGCPYIRVLGDDNAAPDGEVDDSVVYTILTELVDYAAGKRVTMLVETNGVYSDTRRLHNLLNSVANDAVGALWDVHHTFRFGCESPEVTVQNLGIYIKHVHLKDSYTVDGDIIKYCLMGEGDIPAEEAMLALRSINYEGYVSLEWVKKWMSDLQDAGVVFPNFIDYMSRYVKGNGGNGHLIPNKAGTGYYVWEKDTLIDLTFPQVLDRMAEEFPDQYAFRYTTCDYTRTYREFRNDVDTFARALIALGVRRGDHVAIWATNVPEWYITFWAATKIGAVLVTVNTAYKIYEAEYLLRQSDTHTLVLTQGYKDTDYGGIIAAICPELESVASGNGLHAKKLPFLRNVITVGFEQKGCMTWEQALDNADKIPVEEVFRRAAGISKHDVCNMQYTSGTTGFPKGVMLTHYNVVNNGKNIGDGLDLSSADRMMIHVPMFHCFGMVLAMTASVTHGVTMSPIPHFSPKVSLECIGKEKITAFHGVPTMFIAMLEHPDFENTDFTHVRTGIMAGSPCPVKVMREVIEKMNMSEICIVYGQTEASPGCTMSKTTDSVEVRVSTVGSAMFGVECKIIDPETGADLPENADGEFVARGYNVMKGYYKMPNATKLAVDKDGWLHTGDLARKVEGGNYRITGRIKDMIIRGGENLYPKEIEDFIYTHPKVSDVQVVGVPDKKYGEEAVACVVLKQGESLTEDELKEYITANMAKHKVPRYVRFVNSFPMNAAGKILKYKIREESAEELGLGTE